MSQVTARPQNAAAVLARIADRLPDNGWDDRRREARLLLALALGRDDAVLPHEDVTISLDQDQRLDDLIQRRVVGEPISRMRGWREFYSLNFRISPATLDPRGDSETLVDAVLEWLKKSGIAAPRLLDLGTGSGCLLLACLAHAGGATGVGVDLQPDAVSMAQDNAKTLGLDGRAVLLAGSWDDPVTGDFDVIISNPPYIPSGDIPGLMPEVRDHDPMTALDGGDDGLEAWRQLAPVMARRIRPNGAIFVEIGAGQETDVAEIFGQHGLDLIRAWPDYAGIDRCLEFSLAAGRVLKTNNA